MTARITTTTPQPELVQAINLLYKTAHSAGVEPAILELVHLRASQINGCSPCVDSGARQMRKNGETDERLFTVAVWRETPYFTEPERAALAPTGDATKVAHTPGPAPGGIWGAG